LYCPLGAGARAAAALIVGGVIGVGLDTDRDILYIDL